MLALVESKSAILRPRLRPPILEAAVVLELCWAFLEAAEYKACEVKLGNVWSFEATEDEVDAKMDKWSMELEVESRSPRRLLFFLPHIFL